MTMRVEDWPTEIRKEVTGHMQRFEKIEFQFQDLWNVSNKYEEEISNSKRMIADLTANNLSLNEELRKAKENENKTVEFEQLTKVNSELREKLNSIEFSHKKELEELTKSKEDLEKDLASQKHQNKNMINLLQQLEKKIQGLHDSEEKLEEENENLHSTIKILKKKID